MEVWHEKRDEQEQTLLHRREGCAVVIAMLKAKVVRYMPRKYGIIRSNK